jgi:hypothetical protein
LKAGVINCSKLVIPGIESLWFNSAFSVGSRRFEDVVGRETPRIGNTIYPKCFQFL